MGGNFPAGKREGRDRQEEPLIFGTPKTSREKDKGQPGTRRDAKVSKLLKIEVY